MKRIVTLIAMSIVSITCALSQTDWIKYEGNPVLVPGQSGSWDSQNVFYSSVMHVGSEYHMWYSGSDENHDRIGHATSSDGINWIKDVNNPVMDLGNPGTWEERSVYGPCVIKVDDTFHMWYAGRSQGIEKIGHATSTDGVIWTRDPLNPVLTTGAAGSWDEKEVFPGTNSIFYDGAQYHMWYGGCNDDLNYQIGYATSTDGSDWKKYHDNPVMGPGQPGQWDWHGVIPGAVIFNGYKFMSWYSGCADIFRWRIGYATSENGIDWVRETTDPVLDYGPSGGWDNEQSWMGSVLFDSGDFMLKMWYSGGPYGQQQIGYASTSYVGIKDHDDVKHSQLNGLSYFPNPFSQSVTLDYELDASMTIILEIFNSTGCLVYEKHTVQSAGKQQMVWNSTGLPFGIYFITLKAGQRVRCGKVIKLK